MVKISILQALIELKFNLLAQGFYTKTQFAKEYELEVIQKYLLVPYLNLMDIKWSNEPIIGFYHYVRI